MLFRNDGGLTIEPLELAEAPPLLVAYGNEVGLTNKQVAGVRERRAQSPGSYDALFDEMDRMSVAGVALLEARDYAELGLSMNICHGLLNALEVSTPGLERMVSLARALRRGRRQANRGGWRRLDHSAMPGNDG